MDTDSGEVKAWEGRVLGGGRQWEKNNNKDTSVLLSAIKINLKIKK